MSAATLPVRFRDLPRCPFFGNKVAHPTRASAVDHADHLNRVDRWQGTYRGKATVRRCHICDTYHAGRRRTQRQARRR